MPHFIIEHTENTRPHDNCNAVFKKLFEVAASHPTMMQADMKGRVRRLDATYLDDGDAAKSYVHLEVALLSGRDAALKQAIGQDLLKNLQDLFETPPGCQFSVELRDMMRESYFKQVK